MKGTSHHKIILAIGYGRLHLVSSAEWLAKVGVIIDLICGWVPSNPNGVLVRICSRIVGRDLSFGMRKRVIAFPNVRTCSLALIDFFDQFLRLMDRKVFCNRFHGFVSAVGWSLFGWRSRSILRRSSASIFHVRSGAGRGGAIAYAHRLGMKVVVDHSIAHPIWMDRYLRPEFVRQGERFEMGMESPFWRQIAQDCEEADLVMVNSSFVRDTFVDVGFAPEKIRVVYLGVRADFVGLRPPKFRDSPVEMNAPLRLLFTGGFGFRKGAEYILEALRILKERGVPFVMDVVGDASSARALIADYAATDLPVTFHGQKTQDALKQFLAEADVYVFPSLAEGCAQSGMEALAAGLCVVATKESGLPITDGETGCIVPSKNACSIADCIANLAIHRLEIDRLGGNASRLIGDNYTWQKYAEHVIQLYDELTR